jgi:predicted ArsR family transcriptional regulator
VPKLLDQQQESLLLRVMRVAGPLTKRQLSELIDKGGLRATLASKATVDRHVQHLTAQGTLVVHRQPGSAGRFEVASSTPE